MSTLELSPEDDTTDTGVISLLGREIMNDRDLSLLMICLRHVL